MRVGIYSGTFDPIHTGHLTFAKAAIEESGLDKLYFLVEPTPRRKQGVKAFEHRAEMVRLATRDNPKLGSIVLQQNQFNVQDTLPILKNRFHGADIYMLLGDDIFKRLNSWPNVEGLIKSVEFIIGHRELSGEDIKSTLAALEKTRGVKLHYRVIETTLPDISSSKIRLALKRHKTPSGVPRPVLDYIKKQGLYASAMTE